jgi:hypothetical protein
MKPRSGRPIEESELPDAVDEQNQQINEDGGRICLGIGQFGVDVGLAADGAQGSVDEFAEVGRKWL